MQTSEENILNLTNLPSDIIRIIVRVEKRNQEAVVSVRLVSPKRMLTIQIASIPAKNVFDYRSLMDGTQSFAS